MHDVHWYNVHAKARCTFTVGFRQTRASSDQWWVAGMYHYHFANQNSYLETDKAVLESWRKGGKMIAIVWVL